MNVLFFLGVLLYASFSQSQAFEADVSSLSSLPQDEFAKKQKELNKALGDGDISSYDKLNLENLRKKALEVAEINDRCASMSISSVPDERCKDFYIKDLPAFEAEFSRVTGNLYLNKLAVVSSAKSRMTQINGCIYAMGSFVHLQFLPQNLLVFKTNKSGVEPIDSTRFKYYYDLRVSFNRSKEVEYKQQVQKWSSVCSEIIKDPETNAFSPYFINQLNEWFKDSDYQFAVEKNAIYIHPRSQWIYRYKLNQQSIGEVRPEQVVWTTQMLKLTMNKNLNVEIQMMDLGEKSFKGNVEIPIQKKGEIQGVWVGEKLEAFSIDKEIAQSKELKKVREEQKIESESRSGVWIGVGVGVVALVASLLLMK